MARRRRFARVMFVLALLCLGLLLPLVTENDRESDARSAPAVSALEAPQLTMTLTRDQLALSGTTRSAEHEQGLLQFAAARFRDHDIESDFHAGLLLPEHWQPASLRLLYAMAAMDSAQAEIGNGQIRIRGVTTDAKMFAQRLDFLRDVMPADATLHDNVIVVDTEQTLDELCRRTFAGLNTLPIVFEQSSAELRTSSFPSLDKVVDFAWDCAHMTIVISGHSDASGSEAWNRELSRSRAQAVADYLEENGIDPGRLVVEGRGSAVPIAGNDTAYGRSRNRRIEFQLHVPLL